MATVPAPTTPQDSSSTLFTTARVLVIGLAWSAVMLLVLGFWIRAKYAGAMTIQANIVLLAGIAALGLAGWQAFTLWLKQETPEQKIATLTQQRRIFSYVLLAAGLGLLVLAFLLGFGQKPDRTYGFILDQFGESFSVLLFALIALCGGYFLLQPLQAESVSPIQFLTKQVPLLKLIQLVLGVAALLTFGYVAYTNRLEGAYLVYVPELAGLLALSILCFACVLWLNAGSLDEFGARLFVLVFGGSLGVILFFYALGRAYVWRQDIFLGGIAAWQGANAWHFWACAYLQFIALILMFVSFNLARADIRTNVYLRRVMYGYDAIVQGLLVVEMLAVLNIVIYALVPFTYDWTKSRGAYALSDSTKNLISKLTKESHFVVLMSRNSRSYRDVRNLMDNCQALNNKLHVEYISPDTEALKYRALAQKFPQLAPDSPFGGGARGVLLVYGPMPESDKNNTPHAFVTEQKLADMDQSAMQEGGKAKFVFKGEEEIIKKFKFLVQGEKNRTIYIIQGEEEPDINDEQPMRRLAYHGNLNKLGFGAFVDKLKKDNLDVIGLSFGSELRATKGGPKNKIVYAKDEGPDKRKEVPKDCETLIVSPGSKQLPLEAVDAIERYLDRGGNMLVLLDILTDPEYTKLKNTGLEPLLKRYGVEVSDSYALTVRLPVEDNDADTLLATAAKDSENALAKQFIGRIVTMPTSARVLKPVDVTGFKAEPVLQLVELPNQGAMVDKDVSLLRLDMNQKMFEWFNKRQLLPRVSQEPVTVAVAVSDTKNQKPRLVVVGDTEFLSNAMMRFAKPQEQLFNYSFANSSLEWLAGLESIGAAPKISNRYSLPPGVNGTRMILVPGWLMLLTLIGLGMGVWVVRRR